MTTPRKPSVLWIDDDLPAEGTETAEFAIIPARSCKEADQILSGGSKPEYVVVDVFLPQKGWGGGYLEMPGLHFLRHLEKLREKSDGPLIAGYSIVTDSVKHRADALGLTCQIFQKASSSFLDVLRSLQQVRSEPGSERSGDPDAPTS